MFEQNPQPMMVYDRRTLEIVTMSDAMVADTPTPSACARSSSPTSGASRAARSSPRCSTAYPRARRAPLGDRVPELPHRERGDGHARGRGQRRPLPALRHRLRARARSRSRGDVSAPRLGARRADPALLHRRPRAHAPRARAGSSSARGRTWYSRRPPSPGGIGYSREEARGDARSGRRRVGAGCPRAPPRRPSSPRAPRRARRDHHG